MTIRTLLQRLAALALLGLAAPLAAQPYAYVPNHGGDTISVINTATNAVTTITPPPGGCPIPVAANATGTRVYLGNYCSNSVSVIDTTSNTIISTSAALPLDCFFGLAVNPAGTRGYATGLCTSNVVVLDLTTSPVTVLANLSSAGFDTPYGIVVSPDGSRVYVSNYNSQSVGVIDTATNAVSFIATPGRSPYGIALDESGSNLWISHDGTTHGVTRISDPAGTPVVSAVIATGIQPRGIALDATGSTVYVTSFGSNTVSAINTTTLAVTGSSAAGGLPFGVSVTPDGSRVLVANANSNSVSVFNASLALQATVGVGFVPYSFGIFIAPTWLAPPLAPVDAIAALRNDITATILTDTRLRNTLLSPLNAAYTWLSGSDPNRIGNACSNLAKFVSTVGQNYSYGKLDYATASGFVADANAIRVELGCRNPNSGTITPPA
jgi:YVTN family beta-propeller protein